MVQSPVFPSFYQRTPGYTEPHPCKCTLAVLTKSYSAIGGSEAPPSNRRSNAIFISLSFWRNTFGNCMAILIPHGWASQGKRLWGCKDGHKNYLRNLTGRMNHRDIILTLLIYRCMCPLGYFWLQETEHLPARSYIIKTRVIYLTGSLEEVVV